MSQKTLDPSVERNRPTRSGSPVSRSRSLRHWLARTLAIAALPALFALAGCAGTPSGGSSNAVFSISPGTAAIDTNCTGCNTTNSSGATLEQFSATLSGGGAASVTWSVSGGDANSGPGTITTSGQYTPPPYLTANSVQVTVTATLTSDTGAGSTVNATVTITPGFLQPLTPENVALSTDGTVTITGYIAEAGGTTPINYAVSSTSTGSGSGQGSVGSSSCVRSTSTFTYCTVTYTAPGTVSSTASTYVVATIGTSSSKEAVEVLLNSAGISSNPATQADQAQLPTPILLGSSGGNNNSTTPKAIRLWIAVAARWAL